MKILKFIIIIVIITATSLISCKNLTTDAKQFVAIEKELKNKFGENAYYTNLTITYNKSIGGIIEATVTEVPESLKIVQWNLKHGAWKQISEILLETHENTKATDFMFQLNEKINLSTMGKLVEKSSKQLKERKNIDNPTLHMASVKFPKDGDIPKTEYIVMLKPEKGETTFTFSYKLNGELIKMNY